VLQAFGFANARVARDGAELTGYEDWRVLQDLEFPEMVLAIAGDKPVIARKPNYLEDPAFVSQFDDNLFYSKTPQDRRETRAPTQPAKRGSLAELKRQRAREKAEAAQGRQPSASEVLDAKFDLSGPEFTPPEDIPDPFAMPDDDGPHNGTDDDDRIGEDDGKRGAPDDDASDGAKP